MVTLASDSGGGDFTPVPEGPHPAICDMFVDMGLQESKGKYAGKIQHRIYLRWQIPSLRLEYEKDGAVIEGPMSIGAQFTLSLHEKAKLRKVLQQWRGKAFTDAELKGFDVTTVVGVPCLISVSHTPKEGGGIYANVDAVMKLPQQMEKPVLEGSTLIYDKDNTDTFDQLRPWLQDAIKAQKSVQEADRANDPNAWRDDTESMADALDDDIPF